MDSTTKIIELASQNNGIVTAAMISSAGISRGSLKYLADTGRLDQVSRGVYTLPEVWEDEFVSIQERYKRGVFALDTALFLHDLTDRTPHKFHMAFPYGYNTSSPKAAGILCSCKKEPYYSLGIALVDTPAGNTVRAYNAEKTLCEILKPISHTDIAAKTPAPQAPVPSSATPAPPPYQAQMQQHLKRQHLTREAVRRYLQKQTATTAAGNTAPIVTHAPKLPTISSKQATVEAISRGVHYIAAKIKALLSQTVRHAAQSLLALLGAGGVVLLLAMVIGAAAAVIGSPMGILFADESGDPNSIPIAEIVADTNADFGAAINDIVSAHPECSETTITYDYEDGHTWASYWPEVLAIFAVHTNLNSDSDVVVINAAQMQRIQDTFWAMHEITYEVEEVDTTPEPTEDDPDPEQQTDYILHITVSSKTVDELAELYNFTQDQKDILHQLLSEEMRPSLLALCGGIAVADGELCWPLPGHTYISCHFGEVDAFGNAGHRGTDIPAPERTPILAAHSGTVLVSGWNDSYGNQVLLDNGAGLSTRYAHMTQTAVTAGEAVTAGQIIGYVGSTGDSTGNHLHFEVMQNGVRMNPLELVFAQ